MTLPDYRQGHFEWHASDLIAGSLVAQLQQQLIQPLHVGRRVL
jgi:hypothetical protein